MRKKTMAEKIKDLDHRLAQAQHDRDTAQTKLNRIDSILHPPSFSTSPMFGTISTGRGANVEEEYWP